MSIIDARDFRNTDLRRTRSTGDVPQRPAQIHIHQASRHSASNPDPYDLLSGSLSAPPLTSGHSDIPLGRRSPPLAVSVVPPYPQTQTLGGPSRRSHRPVTQSLQQPRGSLYHRVITFFGLGRGASRERRSLVGVVFNLFSGFLQIVIITVILALAGTRLKSPVQPDLTEWVACNRPLGIWACIWVVRAVLACSLTFWGFLRERKTRQRHPEGGISSRMSNPSGGTFRQTRATSDELNTMGHDDLHPHNTSRSLPYTQLYSRLTLLSSLLTLSWFLTAHILEYTSINTCRHSSPHIWWLTFGILCLMYLTVLEVVLLSFVVFIIAPILFLFWNIVLICVGRHPLQTSNMIKPEIGKLPKSLVDRIPLVMYIPPPPEGKEQLAIPKAAMSYPPKPSISSPPSKTRFRFIRKLSSFKSKQSDKVSGAMGDDKTLEPRTWEQHWEQGEYPFVVLEGNRAACAICLMDFEEPKRIGDIPPKTVDTPKAEANSDPTQSLPEPLISEVANELSGADVKLADAGDGAQPLRLLECGHVFHKTCLDPWLTDVSGRCPICQRPVELTQPKNTRKGGR